MNRLEFDDLLQDLTFANVERIQWAYKVEGEAGRALDPNTRTKYEGFIDSAMLELDKAQCEMVARLPFHYDLALSHVKALRIQHSRAYRAAHAEALANADFPKLTHYEEFRKVREFIWSEVVRVQGAAK